ncbi:MAG: fibronectin type III domain-containing protein, partial [Alistipes sp.]|nr:fibronectin type III domain-containing protein [Alistipes sp.]
RIPDVPTMLLELLSHQNFEDMRLASDPEARFIVCRAIYKGILRYLASQYGTPYVVQPLPVADFSATPDESGNSATLRWSPRTDPLEETAAPDFYILYTRVDGGAFDAGRTVESTECRVEIEPGRQYDFRITAANDGGESFPSET